MEYSISLQTLFPFEIGIQALIPFLVLFDIQSCFISSAYSFCFCKSSEINQFLDFICTARTFHSLLRTCFVTSEQWQQRVRLKASLFQNMAIMEKGQYKSQLRTKKKQILSNSRIKSFRGMNGWMDAEIFLLNTSTLVA